MATQGDRGGLQRRKPLERRTPLKAHSELKRGAELKRTAGPKRSCFTPASEAQKEKVARQCSRVWQLDWAEDEAIIDPAHIVSRAKGGCDHEDCIVPLPRMAHRLYDRGELDILPYLTLDEQAHAVAHLGILGALRRTTGERYVPARGSDNPKKRLRDALADLNRAIYTFAKEGYPGWGDELARIRNVIEKEIR
jgi:hypothetical protein